MSKLQKAMEKARNSRAGHADTPVTALPSQGPALQGPPRQEVNPAYARTRSFQVDPEALVRHKVVSFFPAHAMADTLKILQTQVLNRLEERGGNTIMVTGANRHEGTSLTAVNMAVSIARELDRTVLLVDTDLRRPCIHRVLGLDAPRGLSDYLLKEAEIPDLLLHPGIGKLVVLPAGRPLPQSAELLGSPRMKALIQEMRERYPDRVVLFDTPPILESADALAFSKLVDGILFVVEAERTRRDEVKRAMELLHGRPVLGMVLNKARH